MNTLKFTPITTEYADHLRSGGVDAYGQSPEKIISDGDGMPYRHCLENIDQGEPYLIFAIRPFPQQQAYAETGPSFIHANACRKFEANEVPTILKTSPTYILRGYSSKNEIVSGTGSVTPKDEIERYAEQLLRRYDIDYVHVRSASNNCFLTRIDRK